MSTTAHIVWWTKDPIKDGALCGHKFTAKGKGSVRVLGPMAKRKCKKCQKIAAKMERKRK
jgi:hypothetical protein